MITKISISVVAIIVILLNIFLGVGPNAGLPFGYYGKFNIIISELKNDPDIEVIKWGHHKDMTLEDFYITVKSSGKTVELEFANASIRTVDDLRTVFYGIPRKQAEHLHPWDRAIKHRPDCNAASL